MVRTYNILIFPCGSEIGLEIHRSLKYSAHINLFGANSVDDHGKFVYENYIADLPFYNHKDFIDSLKKIVEGNKIDAIYPAMDSVASKLTEYENELQCKIIGSPHITSKICLSKLETYKILTGKVLIPKIFETVDLVNDYPVFMKPEIGYGSRGAKLIKNQFEVSQQLIDYPNSIILEYLPGKEYTVDCFTDKNKNLLFVGPRERNRITNGISVNTVPIFENLERFTSIAKEINKAIHFRGAWFFQVKENKKGELALLEVACRLGGSSALFRNLGVNFALLSVFDALGLNVQIFYNHYQIELDRALSNRYKLDLKYSNVYVDFDDCLLLDNKLNIELISFLYKCINQKKKIILITKHEKNIDNTLEAYRLTSIFDEIIHLNKEQDKWQFIRNTDSIFIDDSFQERKDVHTNLKIPVFAPDAVESLL